MLLILCLFQILYSVSVRHVCFIFMTSQGICFFRCMVNNTEIKNNNTSNYVNYNTIVEIIQDVKHC